MGFLSKIFGSHNQTKEPTFNPYEVVATFGKFWESSGPYTGCVADAKELPFSKATIKVALLVVLVDTTDENLRKHLVNALFALPYWQEGVGNKHIGINVSKLDRNQPPERIAAQIEAMNEGIDRWRSLINAEQTTLLEELKKLEL